jgi:tRNA modification GTPase
VVRNKIDLVGPGSAQEMTRGPDDRSFAVSAKTGAGVERLVSALAGYARSALVRGEPSIVTRERHRAALTEAADALGRAMEQAGAGREDLMAEELRLAARRLGRVTGRVDVEDILDVIFRDFCIGK